ncbi:MAG: alpha/beta fold hydrolase [Promethearchaeota archaeon]
MPYVKLQDDTRMYYIEKGEGPVIVFQHGFLGSNWLFEQQVEYFGNRGYHAIAFDLKGHGQSDKPEDTSYLLPEFAQEIDYALNQIIGDEKIVLLGHSMGGMIALCYATNPKLNKRLKGLILESTASKLQNPVLDQYIEGMRSGVLKVSDRPTIENVLVMLCFNKIHQEANPDLIKEFVDRTLNNEQYVGLATMEAIVQHYDVTDKLDNINLSTLILHGENDIFIPLASSEALDKAIQNSKLIICKGPIGHMLQYECTDIYHASIEEYLQSL